MWAFVSGFFHLTSGIMGVRGQRQGDSCCLANLWAKTKLMRWGPVVLSGEDYLSWRSGLCRQPSRRGSGSRLMVGSRSLGAWCAWCIVGDGRPSCPRDALVPPPVTGRMLRPRLIDAWRTDEPPGPAQGEAWLPQGPLTSWGERDDSSRVDDQCSMKPGKFDHG